MGKLVLSFLIFLIFTFSVTAVADINAPKGAIFLNPGAYSINLSEYLFSTSAFFDYQGHESAMSANTSYSYSDTDLKLNYSFMKNFEAHILGRVRRVQSTSMNGTEPNNLSKLGLESGQVGFKYQFAPVGKNYYALGGRFRQTLYTNPKYPANTTVPTDTVVLGDDGSEYAVDFYSTFLFSSARIDADLSYVSPPNNLSSEIDYKLEGLYQMGSFGLIAGMQGIISMKKDSYANAPSTKPTMTLGSTTLYNSINHENMAAYLGASYDFKKFSIDARGGSVLSGVNTDKGIFALFGITFGTRGETPETTKIEAFKEYVIEGSVLKVSARGNYIKIDQGLSTDVEKGMAFDIYQTDYFGGNVLVASGVVFDIGADWSVIKLVKKYSNIEIKPGFAARGK